MLLRQKSLIIIVLTLFLLLLSILLTADAIVSDGCSRLEKGYVEQNVKRVIKAVETEIASLESMVKSGVYVEEAYQFMKTGNPDYIDFRIADSTFMSQRLNIIMYTDSTGQVMYARAFDWDKNQEMLLSQETAARLAAVRPRANRSAYAGINKGIITLPEGQMLVAAGTIAGSEGNAAAKGVLLLGRYITDAEQELLAERVQLPLDFASWNGELPADFVDAQSYLVYSDEVYSKFLDANYMAGYTALQDIYGEPALVIRVLMPRFISLQARQMLNYFIVMLVVAVLVFGGVMLALLKWNVLDRLATVSNSVKEIAKRKDMSIRLPDIGKDELAELAVNINNMLGALETAQERLKYVGSHDALTGLYNRASFEEYLEMTKNADDSLQVIVADVDGLKLINDTLGHTSGDALLRKAAEVLRNSCPPDAIIARIGGDEFAILLKNYAAGTVANLCQDIKAAIAHANRDTAGITLSISLGFTTDEGRAEDATELLREADNYMYRDKLLHSRSTRSAIVQTLKKALEARDFITEGHAERLQDLVRLMGKEMGLLEARLAELQLFAQFHDIGKVGIPDGILFKPGRLTAEEIAIMRSHSEIGYRIAKSAPDLVFIADWILKHHEWWNGCGYPLGLSGKEIPLECRILALADAYDAMTSNRPYRKAMPKTAALMELEKNAGIQFDPDLTQVFVRILAKLP